jgi:glycosyltransferase involved in cell wall biosynthesis
MHIVQILPELNQGGVERCAVGLSRELVRRGHQSTVISAGGTLVGQIEADGGRHITLDVCSKNPLTVPKRVSDLRRLISDLSPDILHAHSRVPAWLCRLANKTLRIPFVTTVHGFNHVSRYSHIMARGDAVICVSSLLKTYIQKHYGTNGRKISVIPCGVDPVEFDPEKLDQNRINEFKREFDLEGKYIVTNVGRIAPVKDHETFIRSVCACREKIPNIKGVIVGGVRHDKQALRDRLQALVRELGAEEQIVFAGNQTNLAEIYALSDVLVSSSKKPESFGLTLIEAMAMNTPAIATRHGGVMDIIAEGENGRFFTPENPADLMQQIIATRNSLPGNLRTEIIKKFSLEQMATQTLAVYEKLVSTLHIVQILPELNQGGVERGTVELSRELVKRGHQSTVISAGGSQAAQIEKDGGRHITLDVCSKNPLTVPLRVRALRQTLCSMHPAPSILHARSRVPAWLCWFANRKIKIPFVTTVHGFNNVSKYSAIMIKGDRVIYGSTAIKDYILANYAVDASKLRYVPRGIDTAYFDPDKTDSRFVSEFKKKHGLEDRIVVTIVGRITEWKGHDTFIRALAEVQKKHPDAVGVVAGGVWHDKQDFFQSLEKLAADLGADIRFVGSQSNVREIYALSDLSVSASSSKPETFGRTAAEALAMNTPVIASAHGGSLDIVLDGQNGFFFPPNDHMALADRISRAFDFDFSNMREHIEKNFSLDRMTETELAVYRELGKDRR